MKTLHHQFLTRDETVLVIVDIQEKLFVTMHETARPKLLKNVPILIAAAHELGLPILVTEQYPKGIGPTIPELKVMLDTEKIYEKVDFACTEVGDFVNDFKALGRKRILLTGMESHICVYQTALGFRALGYEVYPVVDALATRDPMNHEVAIKLMERAGCIPLTTETALFQLLERAGTDAFKKLQKLIK